MEWCPSKKLKVLQGQYAKGSDEKLHQRIPRRFLIRLGWMRIRSEVVVLTGAGVIQISQPEMKIYLFYPVRNRGIQTFTIHRRYGGFAVAERGGHYGR